METANIKIQRAGHKVPVQCVEQVTAADLERWKDASSRIRIALAVYV